MASLPASMMHKMLKSRMDRLRKKVSGQPFLETQLEAYRREMAVDVGSMVLGGCKAEEGTLGGRPATWFSTPDCDDRHIMIFLHGGGYIAGSVYFTQNHASDLCRVVRQTVVSLDYRLAPENPYPAALEDSTAAYKALLDQGYFAGNITIVGGSAGGGLALATVLALKDQGVSLPGAIVCLSPWVDLTMSQATIKANTGKDIMLVPEFLDGAAELYANGHDRTHPYLSPIFGDLTGLPPILLQVCAEELLLGEVISLANKAGQSGVLVQLDVFEGVWHLWQAMNELVPEAREANGKVRQFIREYTWSADQKKAAEQNEASPDEDTNRELGLIHIHCGDGRGKTTAAIGLILRFVGSGRKAMLVQFLKNGRSSEVKTLRTLPGVHVLTGPDSLKFTHVMNEEDRAEALVMHGRFLATAGKAAKAGQVDLLVLDEVLDAIDTNLLSEDALADFLLGKPDGLEVVLTGRNPSARIMEMADYISNIQCVRHPWQKGITGREGIEF